MKTLKWIPLLIVMMIWLTGCGKTVMKNQSTTDENTPSKVQAEPVAAAPAQPAASQTENRDAQGRTQFLNQVVLFDFDSAVLKSEAQSLLQTQAQWLKENPEELAILVEGHCDERGTDAYNLALGAKRADAVKNFLIDLGVDIRQLDARSFGEEKPAVLGHDEEAWSQNRRASFVID